ncbi:arrestin domain-containing protein 17 [Folsomia candida]|uniref:arrestin domain-containing protein 17 n=1 Tax=Folsomia candida TaxID=158441 RepID=UPI0016054CC7|nr:arrestin domain-containing protein 17 [Folsomia candida]
MGVSIEIEGWDPAQKYFGGDLITGSVIIENKSPNSKILGQDLTIKFTGRAESHWKEQRKNVGHYRQYLVTTCDSEVYFEERITLQNKEGGVDNREIRPGRSEYGFSFRFPVGLPQSFKSDHGKVEYWAEVAYPKSWAPDHRIRLDLNIGAVLDLNMVPRDWARPGKFNMSKTFWWGWGTVDAVLSLPSRIFVPLDDINFCLEVVNHSHCYLKKIRVYFCQVTTYHSKGSEPFKEGARLSKIKCKPVHPRNSATIDGSISVPEVPPTQLGGCALVQPQYGIMIKVIATTFGKIIKSAVLEGRVPVLIGTVPIGRSVPAPASASFASSTSSSGLATNRPATVLRQTIQFSERRVVLTPPGDGQDDDEDDRFTNLAGD